MLGILALSLVFISGCAGNNQAFDPHQPLPKPAPPAVNLKIPAPTPGSLYTDGRGDFFSDFRARRVGDIVVVQVAENSKAAKKNDTKAERTSGMEAGVSQMFGGSSVKPQVKADFTSKHDAKAELKKEDTMTTSIGCTVIEVLTNSNLLIRGSRELRVNGETQYIVLQGVVQPSDISGANTVLHTQLADARIFYTGRGVLTDKQKPGWLARLLDNIWPF